MHRAIIHEWSCHLPYSRTSAWHSRYVLCCLCFCFLVAYFLLTRYIILYLVLDCLVLSFIVVYFLHGLIRCFYLFSTPVIIEFLPYVFLCLSSTEASTIWAESIGYIRRVLLSITHIRHINVVFLSQYVLYICNHIGSIWLVRFVH